MASRIKIDINEQDRAIVRLYGVDLDVTDKADKIGRGSFRFAGDEYNFEIISKDSQKTRVSKKSEKDKELKDEV